MKTKSERLAYLRKKQFLYFNLLVPLSLAGIYCLLHLVSVGVFLIGIGFFLFFIVLGKGLIPEMDELQTIYENNMNRREQRGFKVTSITILFVPISFLIAGIILLLTKWFIHVSFSLSLYVKISVTLLILGNILLYTVDTLFWRGKKQ